MSRYGLIPAVLLYASLALAAPATIDHRGNVNVRTTPDPQGRITGKLSGGDTVEAGVQKGEFTQITYGNGQTGWIPTRLIEVQTAPATTPAPAPVPLAATNTTPAAQPLAPAATTGRWQLALAAVLGGLLGFALGIWWMNRYYQKRLNGLRI
jgi:uncharacterized protein YgiM (DUF1202 family)